MINKNARIKQLKWAVWLTLLAICSVFFLIGAFAPRETAMTFTQWIDMPIFFGCIRYCLYAVIYFRWQKIAHYFNPSVSDELVKSTHRQALGLCLFYEVFFVWNILSLL